MPCPHRHFYPAMFGTLAIAATRQYFCSSSKKIAIIGATGYLNPENDLD